MEIYLFTIFFFQIIYTLLYTNIINQVNETYVWNFIQHLPTYQKSYFENFLKLNLCVEAYFENIVTDLGASAFYSNDSRHRSSVKSSSSTPAMQTRNNNNVPTALSKHSHHHHHKKMNTFDKPAIQDGGWSSDGDVNPPYFDVEHSVVLIGL